MQGLHITLGIFLKLFNLLEQQCKQLDFQLTHYLLKRENVDELSSIIQCIFDMEDLIRRLETGITNCTEHYNWKMIQLKDNDEDGQKNLQQMYEDHIVKLEEERENKVISYRYHLQV